MAKNSRLLSILKVSQDLLINFDPHFNDPQWVAASMGISPKKAQRRLHYLRRQNKVDQNFQLIKREHQVFSLLNQKWDEQWRLVSYDISQENRSKRRKVRKKLLEVGFKQLQRSVWVSPLAVEGYLSSFCRENSPAEFCLFKGELFADNSKKIVKKLWPIAKWQKQGRELLNVLRKKNTDDLENQKDFWSLTLKHPKVPKDLLPFYWPLKDLATTFVAKINGETQ
jgi:DNA-binding transcriptional regulator PaaX